MNCEKALKRFDKIEIIWYNIDMASGNNIFQISINCNRLFETYFPISFTFKPIKRLTVQRILHTQKMCAHVKYNL